MDSGHIIKYSEDENVLLFVKNGYPVWENKKSYRRFTKVTNEVEHLSEVYSDKYFFNGRDGYPNYFDEQKILVNRGVYYAKIIQKIANPGKILDVGCAAGFILKGFERFGWECYGIEPNATMSAYGKYKLNLNIYTGSLEDYRTNHKFDLVSLIQVIGHFYDIDKAFDIITNTLNDNGIVLVESWNMKSLIARVLGKYWHAYSPPSVINWFSDESLKKLFISHGFKLIDTGYPMKQISLNHAMSLIKHNFSNMLFVNRIIDYISSLHGSSIINYPPIDLKWYIFKKL
jgi:2-polyprenyl-3-methyl-5-hydroxy-6-metoxy-1,4-benzoquinol methylase